MTTRCTIHMTATIVFLNWNFAIWTPMCPNIDSPSSVLFFLNLLTCLIFVPSRLASDTNLFCALRASYSRQFRLAFNDPFTLRHWTVLQPWILSDLIIIHKLFEFLKSISAHISVNIRGKDFCLTFRIGAFNV
jgi:hypothetical protein